MDSRVDTALEVGAATKRVVMLIGNFLIMGAGAVMLISGNVKTGLLVFFVGSLAWLLVADIVTAIILVPIIGSVALFAQLFPRRRTNPVITENVEEMALPLDED